MEEDRKEREERPPIFDITSLDTYALLGLFINILSAQAWQHMGLRVKPGTNGVVKDFKRARTAIDCISFLINKLEPHIPEDEKSKLMSLLTDLQINYARLSE